MQVIWDRADCPAALASAGGTEFRADLRKIKILEPERPWRVPRARSLRTPRTA